MKNWFNSFTLYRSNNSGKASVTFPNEVVVDCIESLEAVCKFDHTSANLRNNYRNNDNFISTNCIIVDFDNDGFKRFDNGHEIEIKNPSPEQWITPSVLSQRFPQVAFYAVTSRNHGKVKHPGTETERSERPRFHVYLPLKNPITNQDKLKEIKLKLQTVCPEVDTNAMDASRFIYGHQSPEAKFIDGQIDIVEFFAVHPEITPADQIATTISDPERVIPQKRQTIRSDEFDDDFKKANISIILDSIPADIDEKNWSSVCHALKREGFPFEMFDAWSATGSKYNEKDGGGRTGQRMTLYKWNKKKVSYSNNIGFGWLYKLALSYNPALPNQITKTGQYMPFKAKQRNRTTIDMETGEVLDMSAEAKQNESKEAKPDIVLNVHQAVEAVKPEKATDRDEIPALEVFTADYFNTTEIEEPTPIIDQILYPGLGMLGSPAKMGKSFMMLQLAVCVATGSDFMGFKVNRPGDVLYLDLQGTKARTKKRLLNMGYEKMPDGLSLAYRARNTDNGFIQQIEQWIAQTKRKPSLVIIDMLEQVKGSQKRTEDAYRSDNRILEPLHELALRHDISVFAVMHTRKGNSKIIPDDPFNEIIGSIGQFGTADCAWMILGKRDEERKQLSIICRDNDDGQLDYEATFTNHRWNVAGTVEAMAEQKAIDEYNKNPVVFTIRSLVAESGGGWTGTMTELVTEVAQRTSEYPVTSPEKMKYIINSIAYRLSCEGILIKYPNPNGGKAGRRYTFFKQKPEQMTV